MAPMMREGEGHGRKATSTTNPRDLALTGGIVHQISHIQRGPDGRSHPFCSVHLSGHASKAAVTPPPSFPLSSACVTFHQAPREIHLLLPPTKVGGAWRLRWCGGAFEYRVRTGARPSRPPPPFPRVNFTQTYVALVVGTFKLHKTD